MKISRISKSRDFSKLLSAGTKTPGSVFVLAYKKDLSKEKLHIGITVPKRLAPRAVDRSYIKRAIYGYFRNLKDISTSGYYIIIKITKGMKEMSRQALYKAVKKDLDHIIVRIGLVK